MKQGLYRGMPEAEYRAASGINQSRLKIARHSLQAYRASIQLEDDDDDLDRSGALRLGTAIHAAEASFDLFCRRYVVLGKGMSRSSTEGRRAIEQAGGRDMVLTHVEYGRIMGMRQALHDLPEYQLATMSCLRECAWFWQDPETGLTLKGLVDILPTAGRAIADIKSIRAGYCTPERFANQAEELGYDIQAAFYLDGLNGVLPEDKRDQFWFFVVESSAPHIARAFPMDLDWIEVGRQKYRKLLRQVAEAELTGQWVSRVEPTVVRRPEWAVRRDAA